MDKRQDDLLKLRSYTEEIDKDLTMILQSLQWDRKQILQHPTMVSCRYDSNHKVLCGKFEEHEQECLLRCNGYTDENCFLPDPLDVESSTLIRLSKEDITHIIENASKSDPSFKKVCNVTLNGYKQLYPLCVVGSGGLEPQTLGRLQCAYSSDERRAIHDAVVSAAPSCHDLADLALTSVGGADQAPKAKSRTEILAELRDMRRRRTKYRVAAKSRNYSDVLRDVIKTQMELYNEVLGDTKPNIAELDVMINKQTRDDRTHSIDDDRDKQEHRRELPRHEERDKDKERSRRERYDRDRRPSKYENRDGRNRESSRERRHYSKSEKDRHKEWPVDIKDTYEACTHKDRFRESRDKYKTKEREHNERRDRNHKRKERSDEIKQIERSDRELQQDTTRRRYDKEYSRHDDTERSKEQDKRNDEARRNLTDEERARNLLTEIKREIEITEDDENEREHTGASEINRQKYYRDYISKSNGDQRHANKDKYKHKKRHADKDDDYYNLEKEKHDTDRKRDHRKHKEREESDYRSKHKKSKDDRKESRRDRSDNEATTSRTEDKHRMYYDIYSEIDTRKNKDFNK